MGRLFLILGLALAMAQVASAQSYTQHLQERKPGHGNVNVTQSKEIDDLVNNANVSAQKREPVDTSKGNKTGNTTKSSVSASTNKNTNTPQHNESNKPNHEQAASAHNNATNSAHKTTETAEKEEPVVDTHKKVMRRSYKVNGYRVQVFAGGNSRNDKLKAEQAGNAVKRAMPDQPVYVHFYSPRWICRVGNYRTYEEANNVLRQVQKLGYKQACIVSGKITVAY